MIIEDKTFNITLTIRSLGWLKFPRLNLEDETINFERSDQIP